MTTEETTVDWAEAVRWAESALGHWHDDRLTPNAARAVLAGARIREAAQRWKDADEAYRNCALQPPPHSAREDVDVVDELLAAERALREALEGQGRS